MRIESTPSSAVPDSEIAHDVSPGADAVPFAFQFAVAAEVFSVPSAVPWTFRSPPHSALNDPFADVAVCSVAFHLKFVQALGDGMMLVDDQLPNSAPLPVAVGPDRSLFRSNPTQPAAVTAADSTTSRKVFFMFDISKPLSGRLRPESRRWRKSEDYTIRRAVKSLVCQGFRG